MAAIKGDCIFVIDHFGPARFFTAQVLKNSANVFGFSNIDHAEQAMDKGIIPKVIIFEISSPEYNGAQIFDVLDRHHITDKVQILIVSNSKNDFIQLDWLKERRISLFLEKPYNPVLLVEHVGEYLTSKRSRKFGYFDDGRLPYSTHKRLTLITKRLLDIVVSAISLLLFSPIIFVIGILIKIQSKGPIFYTSPRAGENYKIFRFYKFRTMAMNSSEKILALKHLNQYTGDSNPVFFKVSNDPRVTKLGGFLRNTSLDELPQLVNILLGDMSLVGNRPLPLYEAQTLTSDQYVERFLAPAGLTGLWQVKKRENPEMSVDERINLDIEYGHVYGTWYDIKILFQTFFAMFKRPVV